MSPYSTPLYVFLHLSPLSTSLHLLPHLSSFLLSSLSLPLRLLPLPPFPAAYNMSVYIRRYAKYLKSYCHTYRQLAMDVMKAKKG